MSRPVDSVRIEVDSLGSLALPVDCLWGIHTERAITNFPVSGIPVGSHRHLIRALAAVKKAAALTNLKAGLLPDDVAGAIASACDQVERGDHDSSFKVDVIQGGAGTSTNMNANEVIANLALQSLGYAPGRYDVIDPIGHVNKCQSTNDVYPSAVRIGLLHALEGLLQQLNLLADAFADRASAFATIPKIGRTQLQDAVPMTLGQEFGAFAVTLRKDVRRLQEVALLLGECSMGATAIGTGITADSKYLVHIVEALSETSGLSLTRAEDLIEATWDTGPFMSLSGGLKRVAVKLSKIANDLRLLSSGPQTGFNEVLLPPRQAGSSIMPGKVNPVIPEVINQIAYFVAGHDLTVTLAAENGQLQLNAFEPAMAHALLQSVAWLEHGCEVFRIHCVQGIQANEPLLRGRAGASSAQATALVSVIGYSAATDLIHRADSQGTSVFELAVQLGMVSSEQIDSITGSKGKDERGRRRLFQANGPRS